MAWVWNLPVRKQVLKTIKLRTMKKISTLLFSSLFSLSLLAYDGSRLSISTTSNNSDLKIEVDGRRFNMQDNSITLSNLNEGYHTVKIFKDRRKNGNGFGNGNGNGFGFGRRQDVIYSNSIYLKRGFHSDITVNRFGKVFIDERRMDSNDEWYNEDENDDYHDGNGNGNSNGDWDNGYGNVMSSREFESVKEQIRKEWFENNRLTSAKTIIDKNNFTAQQAKEMVLLFGFENNKLEIAKYAYRKTVDKQNYYVVNDAFAFSSSKDELARFIRQTN
jgi:Domain of unknown function (DUF4476)